MNLTFIKQPLKTLLHCCGVDVVRYHAAKQNTGNTTDDGLQSFTDLSEGEKQIIRSVRPYTMTSAERITAVIHAIQYITDNRISGDIIECGVWRGGSMMAIALTLIDCGDTTRDLYLYDTFEGMSAPTSSDQRFDGASAQALLEESTRDSRYWACAGLKDVQTNLFSTGYPRERIHFIQGKVEDTVPATMPSQVALLRLDTDWYESTKHELEHLFPLLDHDGILILDDYGFWQGARRAVDEYFDAHNFRPYLHRIDSNGCIVVGKYSLGRTVSQVA